jgi:hypothetical protein
MRIQVSGYQLENNAGIGLGDYAAKVSPDGLLLYEGSWGGVNAVPSYDWSAVRCDVVESSFDAHLEGWAVSGGGSLSWQAADGDPAGFALLEVPVLGALAEITSPGAYHRNWSFATAAPAILSIDVWLLTLAGNHTSGPAFYLSGPGGSAQLVLPPEAGPCEYQWQTLVIPLEAPVWTVTAGSWENLLTNVTDLRIGANYADDYSTVGYDNLRLLVPSSSSVSVWITDIRYDQINGTVLRWQANRGNLSYLVESCPSLATNCWAAVPPTNQWWITNTVWTNRPSPYPAQFFRVRAR